MPSKRYANSVISLHTKFYKLSADPFRLSSDFRFSFAHKSYANAISYLKFGFYSEEGFIVITGRPGTGKTTLINQLISEIDPRKVEVANLVTTHYESHDLLNMIAASFNLDMDAASKSSILLTLEKFLKHKLAEGKRVLLIVDEAQGLTVDSLEELRLLSNFQVDSTPLLQIFLIGQEEFRDLIESPGMEQLRQRIVVSSHLEPLTESETIEYVTHRLKRAGWKGDPAITRSAVLIVHRFSGGIPRIINLICGRLLLFGFTNQKYELNAQDMKSVIEELSDELLVIDNDISVAELIEELKSSEKEYLSASIEDELSVSDFRIIEGGATIQAKEDDSTTADEQRFVGNTVSILHGNTVKKVDNHARELSDEQLPAVSEKELEEEIVEPVEKESVVTLENSVEDLLNDHTWESLDDQSPIFVPVDPVEKEDDGETGIRTVHNREPEKKSRFFTVTTAAVLVGLIVSSVLVFSFFKGLGNLKIISTDNQPDVAKVPVNNTDEQVGLLLLPNSDKTSSTLPPEADAVKEVNQISVFSIAEESQQIDEKTLAEPEKPHDLYQRINKLLIQADQQLTKKQLTTPTGDSAWQTYQEILSLEPGNEQALAGIEDIAKTYVIWARDKIKEDDFQYAENLFNKALEVSPADKDALSGLAELDNNNQQKQPE